MQATMATIFLPLRLHYEQKREGAGKLVDCGGGGGTDDVGPHNNARRSGVN